MQFYCAVPGKRIDESLCWTFGKKCLNPCELRAEYGLGVTPKVVAGKKRGRPPKAGKVEKTPVEESREERPPLSQMAAALKDLAETPPIPETAAVKDSFTAQNEVRALPEEAEFKTGGPRLVLDFSEYPEMYDRLVEVAKSQFRTPELQLIAWMHCGMEAPI